MISPDWIVLPCKNTCMSIHSVFSKKTLRAGKYNCMIKKQKKYYFDCYYLTNELTTVGNHKGY